ncbi:unnamed protein product, partial [Arabidopsis halleri]
LRSERERRIFKVAGIVKPELRLFNTNPNQSAFLLSLSTMTSKKSGLSAAL